MVTQTTPHVLAAPINGTHNSVGVDPDAKRTAFEDAATHPDANKTFTSVTIKTPDEVVNDAANKNTAIANGSYAPVTTLPEFINAWRNSNVAYIDVMNDLPNTGITNGERANGASVSVQGNGYTVDLGNNTLKLVKITSNTTITMNNIKVLEDLTAGTADNLSLINANSGIGTNLTVNLHDVSFSPSTPSSKKGPVHAIYGIGARVVISGTNTFDIAGSITRSAGSVELVDSASLTLKRTSNDQHSSVFSFAVLPKGSICQFNGLMIGDGTTLDMNQYDTGADAAKSGPVSGSYDRVTIGDNVLWRQNNFGYFSRASNNTGDWVFGQNDTIIIPRILDGNALTMGFGKQIVFNAGLVLELSQRLSVNSPPIQVSSGTIRFISPKKLHAEILDASGNVKNKATAVFNTSDQMGGRMRFTNATIRGWTDTNDSRYNPNFTKTFKVLEIRENSSIADNSGRLDKNVFPNTTREFKLEGSGVGEVKINYIDQNGNKVGDTDMTLVDNVNFVGQSFNLATKEFAIDKMPAGYKWAIDEQVYSGAPQGSNGQPDGDSATDNDNGDSFGQANYAIVPMDNETYTYNIYVYTDANPNVTYTYVDPFTGAEIASDKATIGSEQVGKLTPAHIGNTIDWTDAFYTQTNIPTGYTYVPSNLLPSTVTQPTKTTITDATTPIDVPIYIYDPSYKGAVALSSVPDINFGSQLISPKSRGKMYAAAFTNELVVNDDRRATKDGWNLTVQQSQPLTSTDKKTVLKDTLFFREKDGGVLASLESGAPQLVYEHQSQSGKGMLETVKPTSNWNKAVDGAGFYLQDNGKLKEGDYETVLTWTLTAGPKI